MGKACTRVGQKVRFRSTGSIDAVLKVLNFMEDETKHNMTKHLLIEHIWDKYSEEKANALKVIK